MQTPKFNTFSLLLLLLFISIGFAYISSSLNMEGKIGVLGNKFDVHFENVQINEKSIEIGKENTKASINPTDNRKVEFNVTLNKPGDFYEFTVDIKNSGTIDAMLNELTITPLSSKSEEVLNYIVTYKDGKEVKINDGIHPGKVRTLKVRLEYDTDGTPEQIKNININNLELSIFANYTQADDNAKYQVFEVITGNGQTIGDEVAIEDQHFYILSKNQDEVQLFSKYNLKKNNSDTKDATSLTNKQDTTNYTNSIEFSTKCYWEENNNLKEKYKNNPYPNVKANGYPADTYDENTLFYTQVLNYKNYIESLGAKVNEIRLMTLKDLTILSNNQVVTETKLVGKIPEWAYSTNYWLGTSISNQGVYFVNKTRGLCINAYSSTSGVRPVLSIPSSLLD